MANFTKDELFCKKCLIHDHFFVGGGSWSSDLCSECGGFDCVSYKNLTIEEKYIAREKFDKMWKKQWRLK
jgi:hypothetical protein